MKSFIRVFLIIAFLGVVANAQAQQAGKVPRIGYNEIANILRVSTNAVYTQKSRVLGKLREALRNSGVL